MIQLRSLMQEKKLKGRWLRVDWVEKAEEVSWKTLHKKLSNTKRNYYRFGLALDEEFNTAFLEQELNANAMLYGGNTIKHAVVNESNFLVYAQKRFSKDCLIDFSDDQPVFILSTCGIFCDENHNRFMLNGPGLDAGRRRIEDMSKEQVFSLIKDGSDYLARQVKDNGQFVYGTHPCFNREIDTYNALRHASTLYSMIEAWELTQSEVLKSKIDNALDYLVSSLIKELPLPDGSNVAFLIDIDNEIKLGGNAVCLLALTQYCLIFKTDRYLDLLEKLALGILHMQNADFSFSHILSYPSLKVKEKFRIIYYDGEATFGLMRLYELTGDKRWLNAVENSFKYFIEQQHWKHHDHWLSYCVNELTAVKPEKGYYQFGIQNFLTYLDFIKNRITTYPTLLELIMAADKMLSRMKQNNSFSDLLDIIDFEKFYQSLEARAHNLLNGFFWPEYAMYFARPSQIAGSFFIRHHSFRIRIDDIEHNLSGLVAYYRYKINKLTAEQ